MYPYQCTPMGNPYLSPISRGYLWVIIPKNPKVEHNHGYTVKGTPNCPLNKSCKTLALDSPYRPLSGKTIVDVFFSPAGLGCPPASFALIQLKTS